jgi:zinc transporter ZupT
MERKPFSKSSLRILHNSTESQSDRITSNATNLISVEHVWGGGIGVTLGFLTLSLILTLLIVSCQKSKSSSKNCLSRLNSALISLAIGSLFGDTVIHIIPQLYGEKQEVPEDKRPNPHICSLLIVVGFVVFFTFEKLFVLLGVGHSHGSLHEESQENEGNKESHEHVSCHEDQVVNSPKNQEANEIKNNNSFEIEKIINSQKIEKIEEAEAEKEKENKDKDEDKEIKSNEINPQNYEKEIEIAIIEVTETINPVKTTPELQDQNLQPSEVKISTVDIKIKTQHHKDFFNFKNKKPVGMMSLISSVIHNTLDGVAIGIVFAGRNTSVILSTCVALLLHEIPKELGDAGILISSNFKVWSVVFWNFLINICSIVGAIIGLSTGEISDASQSYAMAFVAGNFLYISIGQMVPEIIKKKGIWEFVLQICGILIGIGAMFIILLFEKH